MSYEDELEKRGFKLDAWVTFGDWEGDYAAILSKDGQRGFVVIGYGSCSGCDAWQDVTDCLSESKWSPEIKNEVKALMDSIENDITWGTNEELISKVTNSYPNNGDFNWYRHDDDYKKNIDSLVFAIIRGTA